MDLEITGCLIDLLASIWVGHVFKTSIRKTHFVPFRICVIFYAKMFDFMNSGFLDIYEQKQHRERHHETRLEKLV